MKKAAIFFCLLGLLASLCGCSQSKAQEEYVIKEELFWTSINELYVNTKDYLGRDVRLSGVLYQYEYEGENHNTVIRMASCCGPDDVAVGLEFNWDGDLPEQDTWIEVVGELISVTEDGQEYLMLTAKSVTETDAGSLTVSN